VVDENIPIKPKKHPSNMHRLWKRDVDIPVRPTRITFGAFCTLGENKFWKNCRESRHKIVLYDTVFFQKKAINSGKKSNYQHLNPMFPEAGMLISPVISNCKKLYRSIFPIACNGLADLHMPGQSYEKIKRMY